MQEVTYTVHIEPAEEGGFVAYFPALPGCHTQGETFDEFIAMAKDWWATWRYYVNLENRKPIASERTPTKQVGFEFL